VKRLLPWLVLAALALASAWWWASSKRASVRTEPPELAAGAQDDGATALLAPVRESSVADVPAADAPPLIALRIRSATGPYSGAPRVPDIAFEVCRTSGWDRSTLATGRTDASGEARLELPLGELVSTAFGGPPLCVRVIEPGFQQQSFRGSRVHGEPRAYEFCLQAKRGATLRGTVVDARGAPVRADVSVRRWNVDQGGRLEVVSTGGGSGRDGRFEQHVADTIEDGVLIVEAGEHGTGALADVDVPLDSAPQDLRVVVHGEGVLRGQVLDGSGAPAARAALLVLHATLDDGRGCPPERDKAVALRLRGAGHPAFAAKTDDGGRFEVRGLLADTYVVRARAGPENPQRYDQLLTPRPVAADGSELALRMARPTLLVRLLDAEGRAWQNDENARAKAPPDGTAEWPATPEVLAYAVEDVGGRACPAERKLWGRELSDAETAFDVVEGTRYLVGAIGAGFDGRLQEVVLEPGDVQVELRARDAGELGSIVVHVVHEGRELSWTSDEGPFELALFRADQTVELLCVVYPEDPPYRFRVPAGTYRVSVDGAANAFGHGGVIDPRELGRGEAEVTVRAGATHELAVEIDEGARLEVTLEGEVSEADRRAVVEGEPWLESLAMQEDERERRIEERAALAELHLVDGRGRRTPLVRLARADNPGAGENELDIWELGATILSERMPTGAHTLVGRLPSGRTARAEVVLRAGEVTRVQLVF